MSYHSQQVRALRQRDGDDCWLCNSPIDFSIADKNHPMHYSRDHLKPRAAGGSDELSNLRLAHRECNRKRGCSWSGRSDWQAWQHSWRPGEWDSAASARQPAGGRVLILGDDPVLPCM